MRIESPWLRNTAILTLIAVCFTIGTFAAELVGNIIQPPPAPASAGDSVENTESPGSPSTSPAAADSQPPGPGGDSSLPAAAKAAP